MIFTSPIDDCFRPPRALQPTTTAKAVLHILRRDLENLYGSETRWSIRKHKSPMLALAGIMSGVDLMTKLMTGKTSTSGAEFRCFLKTYARLKPSHAKAVYRFRCALIHNYGLYMVDEKNRREYTFELDDSSGNLILLKPVAKRRYRVGFWKMKQLFLDSIEEFQAAVSDKDSNILLNNFMAAMASIGYFEIT